mgnify:FL=1|jgi:hypothetical protein
MTLLHYAARHDLRRAWTALQAGQLDDALKLYETAIGTATPDSLELRAALLGAGYVSYCAGELKQAVVYARELSSPLPMKQAHPKDRQLYITIDDLMKLPYLRKHELWGSSPGRFNPEKAHLGHQAIIAATVWEKRPHAHGNGYSWVASVYWLKDYDPPFDYSVYTGGDSRPCEAVTPVEVLAAVSSPRRLEVTA